MAIQKRNTRVTLAFHVLRTNEIDGNKLAKQTDQIRLQIQTSCERPTFLNDIAGNYSRNVECHNWPRNVVSCKKLFACKMALPSSVVFAVQAVYDYMCLDMCIICNLMIPERVYSTRQRSGLRSSWYTFWLFTFGFATFAWKFHLLIAKQGI